MSDQDAAAVGFRVELQFADGWVDATTEYAGSPAHWQLMTHPDFTSLTLIQSLGRRKCPRDWRFYLESELVAEGQGETVDPLAPLQFVIESPVR